ncbi:MAG: alpha/beta fold hydrolase, partial [Catenulispora sp.]|nr:alpha/beta fold hydrolase [Catenulispora sp.]
ACLRALAPVPRAVRETGSQFAGPALRERLARGTEAEQVRILTDLVRSEAAAVLGHDSPEAVAVDITFLEQGFDSLTAVELRNRVNAITGLRLTGAMAFDHPTPGELAPFLREKLAAAGVLSGGDTSAKGARDSRRYRTADTQDTQDTGAKPSTLSSSLKRAVHEGRGAELLTLVRALAAFRPRFAAAGELTEIPEATVVARGPQTPQLICFPSFAGSSDAQEFARFAAGFRGRRAVSVVPTPGFVAGEPLAADVGALLDVCAESVRKTAGDKPAVLVGFSSGGLVAHAVAARLAELGVEVARLVLIDTFVPEDAGVPEDVQAALAGAVLAANAEQQNLGGDEWLTALAHYYSMDWRGLSRTAIPTLLLRATEPVPGLTPADLRPSTWDLAAETTVADVPGDHFSMLRDHAATTAQAVAEWLDT